MAAGHGTLTHGNASQKNCSGDFFSLILYFNSVENHKRRHSNKKFTGLDIPNKYKLKYI